MTQSKPSVTSTIPGNVGLRVAIKSPACRTVYVDCEILTQFFRISQGTSTLFQAQLVNSTVPVTWTWSSDLDGNFGNAATTSTRLSVGRHVVRIRAVDDQRNIAEDKVIVNVGMSTQSLSTERL